MDAKQVIATHKRWKDNFRIAMATREQFDLDKVCSDNCCEFGKWLYSDGQERFGQHAEYETCRTQHAQFHKEAVKVAALINDGHLLQADQILANSSSPYSKASEALGIAVIGLFRTEETEKSEHFATSTD